jgi:hypothetical protein
MHELHCGACGQEFTNIEDLMFHLERCRVAKILLPMAHRVHFGCDRTGHPIAGLIVGIRKSVPLIRKYAMSIACEIDTFRRAEIHRELCMSLGVSRSEFKPFESESIRHIPTFDEAEDILWKAIEELEYTMN